MLKRSLCTILVLCIFMSACSKHATNALPADSLPANDLSANDLPANDLPANDLPADFLSEDFWETATLADVQKAIENGANVNARDKDGWTPLIVASRYNSKPDMIETLIKHGADVNARSESGRTPFIYAIINNSEPKVIEILIKHGADVNARDEKDTAILDSAKKKDKIDNTGASQNIQDLMNNPSYKSALILIENSPKNLEMNLGIRKYIQSLDVLNKDEIKILKEKYSSYFASSINNLVEELFYEQFQENNIGYSYAQYRENGEEKLREHGILRYESDGITYYKTSPLYMAEIFRNQIPNFKDEEARYQSLQNRRSYADDAALMISYDELCERINMIDEIEAKFPNEHLGTSEKSYSLEWYRGNMLFLLLYGVDNSPVYGYKGKVLPEIKSAILNHIKKYPNTKSTKEMLERVEEWKKKNKW